jgi:hypothetical protein
MRDAGATGPLPSNPYARGSSICSVSTVAYPLAMGGFDVDAA